MVIGLPILASIASAIVYDSGQRFSNWNKERQARREDSKYWHSPYYKSYRQGQRSRRANWRKY